LDYKLVLNGDYYPYKVRYSKRSRYLRIKLSPEGIVTLVVPEGVLLNEAQRFLESKRSWLETNIQKLPEVKAFSETRPTILRLSLLSEQWQLQYSCLPVDDVTLVHKSNQTLLLSGCVDNKDLVLKELGKWLKLKASKILPDRLSMLSELHGFHYNRLTIRGQKTRWGSCSSQKNINLNYKLLFLEQSLVDYVLIHELCHTLEMNHSKRFWSLVADCDENYKQHDYALNQASRDIPI